MEGQLFEKTFLLFTGTGTDSLNKKKQKNPSDPQHTERAGLCELTKKGSLLLLPSNFVAPWFVVFRRIEHSRKSILSCFLQDRFEKWSVFLFLFMNEVVRCTKNINVHAPLNIWFFSCCSFVFHSKCR